MERESFVVLLFLFTSLSVLFLTWRSLQRTERAMDESAGRPSRVRVAENALESSWRRGRETAEKRGYVDHGVEPAMRSDAGSLQA